MRQVAARTGVQDSDVPERNEEVAKEFSTKGAKTTEFGDGKHERIRNAAKQTESTAIPERDAAGFTQQGGCAEAARAGRRAEAGVRVRRARSDQSGVEQLSGTDLAQGFAQSGGGSGAEIGRRRGSGAHHRRHHEAAH